MPLCTAYLVRLSADKSIPAFLRAISTQSVKPLVVSRVIRWIIRPELLSVNRLTNTEWHLLIIVPAESPLPATYLGQDWLSDCWAITAGVPSGLTRNFESKNGRLLRPSRADVPALTGSLKEPQMAGSAQGLELNKELLEWSKDFQLGKGAVSMLNLLAFHPGKAAHESYLEYGKAFAESIGSRRGGTAKIVGKVVPQKQTPGEDTSGWDEIALAHYPSIVHFTDMLASRDYQEVNHKHRLPALRDTCILCTSELDPDLYVDKAKL